MGAKASKVRANISVVLPDGEMRMYPMGINSRVVMEDFPGFFLSLSCTRPDSFLCDEKPLKPGTLYFLYPILNPRLSLAESKESVGLSPRVNDAGCSRYQIQPSVGESTRFPDHIMPRSLRRASIDVEATPTILDQQSLVFRRMSVDETGRPGPGRNRSVGKIFSEIASSKGDVAPGASETSGSSPEGHNTSPSSARSSSDHSQGRVTWTSPDSSCDGEGLGMDSRRRRTMERMDRMQNFSITAPLTPSKPSRVPSGQAPFHSHLSDSPSTPSPKSKSDVSSSAVNTPTRLPVAPRRAVTLAGYVKEVQGKAQEKIAGAKLRRLSESRESKDARRAASRLQADVACSLRADTPEGLPGPRRSMNFASYMKEAQEKFAGGKKGRRSECTESREGINAANNQASEDWLADTLAYQQPINAKTTPKRAKAAKSSKKTCSLQISSPIISAPVSPNPAMPSPIVSPSPSTPLASPPPVSPLPPAPSQAVVTTESAEGPPHVEALGRGEASEVKEESQSSNGPVSSDNWLINKQAYRSASGNPLADLKHSRSSVKWRPSLDALSESQVEDQLRVGGRAQLRLRRRSMELPRPEALGELARSDRPAECVF